MIPHPQNTPLRLGLLGLLMAAIAVIGAEPSNTGLRRTSGRSRLKLVKRFLSLLPLLLALSACAADYSANISSLIAPAKLATLGKRIGVRVILRICTQRLFERSPALPFP
jgi:hypothetical protein